MKNKGIIIAVLIIIILLIIGYNTNWFGLKNSININNSRLINKVTSIISCPSGCTLSLNTSGASQTASQGGNTYTCRCSDGSTTAPIVS